ncbi:MAG TPA: DUF6632 domain-containing protein [Myxococcota bacterium]|nr:DUF6632 domain-containing protein [Myxococcota bacterium]
MSRERLLPMALRVIGASLFALPLAFAVLPAEFRWSPHHPPYERMIVAIYAALGVCMWRAARDPRRHVLLIDFVILSSVLHGAVMAYDAVVQQGEHAHLWGDVPLLFGVAALFYWLRPSERGSGG